MSCCLSHHHSYSASVPLNAPFRSLIFKGRDCPARHIRDPIVCPAGSLMPNCCRMQTTIPCYTWHVGTNYPCLQKVTKALESLSPLSLSPTKLWTADSLEQCGHHGPKPKVHCFVEAAVWICPPWQNRNKIGLWQVNASSMIYLTSQIFIRKHLTPLEPGGLQKSSTSDKHPRHSVPRLFFAKLQNSIHHLGHGWFATWRWSRLTQTRLHEMRLREGTRSRTQLYKDVTATAISMCLKIRQTYSI